MAREFEREHEAREKLRPRSPRATTASPHTSTSVRGVFDKLSGSSRSKGKGKGGKKKDHAPPMQYALPYSAFSGNVDPRASCSSPLLLRPWENTIVAKDGSTRTLLPKKVFERMFADQASPEYLKGHMRAVATAQKKVHEKNRERQHSQPVNQPTTTNPPNPAL